MRFMVLFRGTRLFDPPPGLMDGIMKLGAEATTAGALLDTAALAPSVSGARVQLSGGLLSVVDQPFAPAGELLSYAVYQVAGKEAIDSRVGVPAPASALRARLGGRRRDLQGVRPRGLRRSAAGRRIRRRLTLPFVVLAT